LGRQSPIGLLPSDRPLTRSKVGCLLPRIHAMRKSRRLALKGLLSLVAALSLAVSCSTSPGIRGSNGVSSDGRGGDAASPQDALAGNDSAPAVAPDAGVLIGAGGGTFTTADGVTVEVPAGALSSNVTITVTRAPNAPLPPGSRAVGDAYTFGPEGTQFQHPVTVTLPFDPAKLPAGTMPAEIVAYTAPAGSTNYTTVIAGPADSTHVRAETTHFSTFLPAIASCVVLGCPAPAPALCIGVELCLNPCGISWNCGGDGWCAPLCSGNCNGFCSGSSGSGSGGSGTGSGSSGGSGGGSGAGANCNSGDAGGGGSSSGGSSGGGGASSFLGTWSCQETSTLTNTSPGAGPMTRIQPTVWTITAGANGQIAIAATTPAGAYAPDGGIPCNFDATISGSTATLPAGQTCISPPITGSDGHTDTYTSTLSCGSVMVSGNTMTYTIIGSVVGNSPSPGGSGPPVSETSTGTCAR